VSPLAKVRRYERGADVARDCRFADRPVGVWGRARLDPRITGTREESGYLSHFSVTVSAAVFLDVWFGGTCDGQNYDMEN
jgi:hypothetical protein